MPKKPPFSYKLSQRPGRFKLYERSGNEKRHIVNVIVKVGLTESVAKRLTDRLNSEWRMRATAGTVPDDFHKRVLEEARLLLTDPNEDLNPDYNRAIVDLTANILGDADAVAGSYDAIQAYEYKIRTHNWGGGSPELKAKLEQASELALKLEYLMHDIKEDDLEGITDGMATDIEGLAFGIQQLIEGQEYDSDPTREKLLQEVQRRDQENEEDPTDGPLPKDEYNG